MSTTPEAPATTARTPKLNAALARVQAEIPRITKDEKAAIPGKDGKRGYDYKYANLTAITDAALPLLGKNGLAFTAWPTLNADGKFVMEYSLIHESGEQRDGVWPLASSAKPQDLGGLLTYYRRYALCAVTGIAPGGDDDDAEAANVTQHYDRPRGAAGTPGSLPERPDEDDGDNGDWLAGIDSQAAADKRDEELRKAFASGTVGSAKAKRLRAAIQDRARELALSAAPAARQEPATADKAAEDLAADADKAVTLSDLKAVHDKAAKERKLSAAFMRDGAAITIQAHIAARRQQMERRETAGATA